MPDDALAAFGGTDQVQPTVVRIHRGIGRARDLAVGLLPPGMQLRRERTSDHRAELAAAAERLDEASDRLRRKAFARLHRPLGPTLAAAWVDWRAAPYGLGAARRAYRAPGHPTVSAPARGERVRRLSRTLLSYEQDAAWFATYGGHLPSRGSALGELLGVAIDGGDTAVRDTLLRVAVGRDETGRFGAHVPLALLSAADPAGWDAVERLLLAAQRQEGLRQAVLEAVDLAHPTAFRRMLDIVIDEGLTRFAATVRAVSVWLGESFEVRDRRRLDELLDRMRTILDDDGERERALAVGGADEVQLALFATSFRDAVRGGDAAVRLLGDPDGDRRLAAIRHLADLQLDHLGPVIGGCVADEDLRVVAVAVQRLGHHRGATTDAATVARLLDRLDGDVTVPIGIHRPWQYTVAVSDVADLVARFAGPDDDAVVAAAQGRMSPQGRAQLVRRWADAPQRYRAELLDVTTDRSSNVRELAFRALGSVEVTPDEAPAVEALLTRKAGDVRRGATGLLANQRPAAVLDSVERLLGGSERQVAAAVELLAALREAGHDDHRLQRLTAAALDDDTVVGADRAALTGTTDTLPSPTALVDHEARTPAVAPTGGTRPRADDPALARLLTSLDAWLVEHRDVEVDVVTYTGSDVRLVGDLGWLRRPPTGQEPDRLRETMPLAELLEPWVERTFAGLDEPAALAARAQAALAAAAVAGGDLPRGVGPAPWVQPLLRDQVPVDVVDGLATTRTIEALLPWLAAVHATGATVTTLLDDVVGSLAVVAASKHATRLATVAELTVERYRPTQQRQHHTDWRSTPLLSWWTVLDDLLARRVDLDTERVVERRWRLAMWLDEPAGRYDPARDGRTSLTGLPPYASVLGDVPRRPARRFPPLGLLLRAHSTGAATDADLDDALLAERTAIDAQLSREHRSPLAELTRRTPADATSWATTALDRAATIRDAIVDAEIGRGELPTPTTPAAMQLRSVIGADRTLALLAGLGRAALVRGYVWRGGQGKAETFSRLLRVSFPADDDDHESFADAAARHRVGERRLVDLAMYAPQWAPDVELTVGWAGLTDAVRWVHAHTKDGRWSVDADVRAEWDRTTHEQTPLSPQDLIEGAVDVEWFRRVRATLGDARLSTVLEVGKYASSSGGHKRAELFARALRGELGQDELTERIEAKRHQDSVRALGLVPLPDDPTARDDALLARYETIRRFDHGRRRFGQQRQASEGRAVEIALDNLARTAGFRDAQRLTWRMEADAVADLASGPVVVDRDDVRLSLSIDEEGAPSLDVARGERRLKNVPRALGKDEEVVALKARAKQLRRQSSRMRRELEAAMVRGDRFPAGELAELLAHPLLRPGLRRLVVVGPDGALGLPSDGARMREVGGRTVALPDEVRIAHPVDLLASGDWSAWQHRLFADALRQPFKQVFRELYVPTTDEQDDRRRSTRWAGHQVQAAQAAALFGSRGWVVDRDGGAVRTFHAAGITALVTTTGVLGTVAEVEDPTVEHVWFVPVRGAADLDRELGRPLPLDEVPRRLFSEVMRDVDLVVSVAHAGGVDPETSASTVEVRRAIVDETVALLGLENVELTATHALVTGVRSTYSVHLGSGQVHRRPGNAVCIIPVGAQHRGRVFLPFVDDDPKTAEIVSKVVLLADDGAIKDPTILAQLGDR